MLSCFAGVASTAHDATAHDAACDAACAAHDATAHDAVYAAHIAANAENLCNVSRAATAEVALKVLVQVALLERQIAHKAANIVVGQALALHRWWLKIIEQSTHRNELGTTIVLKKVYCMTFLEKKSTVESAAQIALDVLKKAQNDFRALRLLASSASSKELRVSATSWIQNLRCGCYDELNDDAYEWLNIDTSTIPKIRGWYVSFEELDEDVNFGESDEAVDFGESDEDVNEWRLRCQYVSFDESNEDIYGWLHTDYSQLSICPTCDDLCWYCIRNNLYD